MRIRRAQNRIVEGKQYDRWLLTLPPDLVGKLGWNENTEVEAKVVRGGVKLVPATGKSKVPLPSSRESKEKARGRLDRV
jgi:hypothetical protein